VAKMSLGSVMQILSRLIHYGQSHERHQDHEISLFLSVLRLLRVLWWQSIFQGFFAIRTEERNGLLGGGRLRRRPIASNAFSLVSL